MDKFKIADKNFIDTLKSLEFIITDFNLKKLLTEITANEKWLSFISNKSFSHSNGFDKFTLFRGSKLRVRLHIYWLDNRIDSPNIHDHRWNFSSLIIKGGYKSEIFQIRNMGIDKFLYKYYSQATSKSDYELDFIKKVKLLILETKDYSENDINNGNAGEIHRIILNDNKITVTLFLTSDYENEYARVFTNDDKLKGEKVNSNKLSKKEIIQKLKSIL